MTSIDRPLSGSTLIFDLDDTPASVGSHPGKRSARTLVKSGVLRVTLVTMDAGGHTADHHAEGPITIHVLSGDIRFEAGGRSVDLHAGQLLYAEAGLEHRVSSAQGGAFLLTVTHPAAPDPGTAA